MTTSDNPLEHYAYVVIGAAIEVHRALGPGYLEAVYEEGLCYELELRQIPHLRQHPIGEGRIDILVADCLIVELKAVEDIAPVHTAQVISYLKATGLDLGLLLNFKVPVLKQGGIKRIVY